MGRRYQSLKGTAETECAVVAGSGPSIQHEDSYLLERVQKYCPVYAVNASVKMFQTGTFSNTRWVFKNMRPFRDTKGRVSFFHITHIFTRQKNYKAVRLPDGAKVEKVGFDEDQGEAYSLATTATAAARIAHHIGHRRLFLLGMDFTPIQGIPYASQLQFQHCIYRDRQEHYFRKFEKDWRLLKKELTDTEIINCSPVSRDRVFQYRPFRDVLPDMEEK